jgi:hypothetical protein
VEHTRRIFLKIVFSFPIFYFLPSKSPQPKQIETEDGFILVNGWLLKKGDLQIDKDIS